MSGWFTDTVNVAAAIAQVILSFSPAPDIYRVHCRKSTGEMAALPLVAMAVNNHLWMFYGYFTNNLFPLAATQAFSQLAAIFYCCVYFYWSSELKCKELRKLYARAFVLHCAVTLYFVAGVAKITGQSKTDVGEWFGYVGVVVNIWMYASPLGTLKHVIQMKSSESIPINLSIMILVSTLLWLASGILVSDFFLAGINAVGALLSFVQIIVYYHYKHPREETAIDPLDPTTVENVSVLVISLKDNSSSYKPLASR